MRGDKPQLMGYCIQGTLNEDQERITLRQALEKVNETIPDQRMKQTKQPTAAWIFRLFHGVHVWTIRQGETVQTLVVNLTSLMKRIIRYFGPSAEKIYSLSG